MFLKTFWQSVFFNLPPSCLQHVIVKYVLTFCYIYTFAIFCYDKLQLNTLDDK